MRYLSFVLFLFFIQLSLAVVNATDILQTEYQEQSDWFQDVNQKELADESYVQSQISPNVESFGFGDFIKGILYFVKAVGWGIISVPYTLNQFGITYSNPLNYLFSLPIYFLYFLAIAQFISNRATKTMR